MLPTSHSAHNTVNWQSPVDWSCPFNRGLVLWYLNVPHWQGGMRWRSLEGRFSGILNGTATWATGTKRRGGWGQVTTSGTTGYVETAEANNVLNLTGAMSISLWFNRISAIGTTDTMLMKSKSGLKQYAIDFNSSAKVRFGDETGVIVSATTIAVNTWYHGFFTYDGSGVAGGLSIYLNGVLETPTTAGTFNGIEAGTGNLYFGSKAATSEFSNVAFDDVRIWNRLVRPHEVRNIYADSVDYSRQALTRINRKRTREVAQSAAVGGPYRVDAHQIYSPGSVSGEIYNPGAQGASIYNPGSVAGEVCV